MLIKIKRYIFQSEVLQAVFSVGISILCLIAGHFCIVWLYGSGLLSQKWIVFLAVCASSAILAIVIFFVMKMSMKLNITWSVTLPKAAELSQVLTRIGIIDFDEQINFVSRRKLDLFVSPSPILILYKDNARVKRYIYIKDRDKLQYYNGDKRLCLSADDYENLLQEYEQNTGHAYSIRIVELEQNVTDLKAVNSIQSADITKFTEDIEKLSEENADYRKRQRTAPGRKELADKREIRRIPFWRVAAPLVNRLIAGAGSDTKYTRPQIQTAFQQELESFPELKPAIQKLLHTAKKEPDYAP